MTNRRPYYGVTMTAGITGPHPDQLADEMADAQNIPWEKLIERQYVQMMQEANGRMLPSEAAAIVAGRAGIQPWEVLLHAAGRRSDGTPIETNG